MRTKVIAGSVIGALAIHVALVACGQMPVMSGDGGAMGSMMAAVHDAAVDVLGLETGNARAEDSGTGTCTCPVPQRAETSFSLKLERGNGPESPMTDFSTATVQIQPTLSLSGVRTIGVLTNSSFYIVQANASYRKVSLSCRATLDVDRMQATSKPTCDSDFLTGGSIVSANAVEIRNLSETSAEIAFQQIQVRPPCDNAACDPVVTFTNVIFRTTDPSARFITPPRAYKE